MIGFWINMLAVVLNGLIGFMLYDTTGEFPTLQLACMAFNTLVGVICLAIDVSSSRRYY